MEDLLGDDGHLWAHGFSGDSTGMCFVVLLLSGTSTAHTLKRTRHVFEWIDHPARRLKHFIGYF